ncbi:hypothetical protein AB6A40_007892 [Gnathostoma spinigerum]|uniref:Nucleolar protein 10 n=1 Tax=Gnathostoma spinigerum TaxID=75299 RepID=A0ABD6EMT9_9BILA
MVLISVYDDYKFVTGVQLEELGLSHLIGTSIVRAYMHGYFIDNRLYSKANAIMKPFAYDRYKEDKVMEELKREREGLSAARKAREQNEAKVNKELAIRLQTEAIISSSVKDKQAAKKGTAAAAFLSDNRFSSLFSNPDFEIDKDSEQYKRNLDSLEKLNHKKDKIRWVDDKNESEDEAQEVMQSGLFMEDPKIDDNAESSSSNEYEEGGDEESSTDDDNGKRYRKLHKTSSGEGARDFAAKVATSVDEDDERKPKAFELIELSHGEDYSRLISSLNPSKVGSAQTLGEMREEAAQDGLVESGVSSFGGKEVTFRLKPSGKEARFERGTERQKQHIRERKQLRRAANEITRTLKKLPVGRGRGRGMH